MKQLLFLTVALLAAFLLTELVLGTDFAIALGFGAITTIAVTNAATFFWLWWARTTPLALGMAFSWFGQASISIWWFVSGIPQSSPWITAFDSKILFTVLSIYIVGGGLHVFVVRQSVELSRRIMILPAVAVFAIALAADSLF